MGEMTTHRGLGSLPEHGSKPRQRIRACRVPGRKGFRQTGPPLPPTDPDALGREASVGVCSRLRGRVPAYRRPALCQVPRPQSECDCPGSASPRCRELRPLPGLTRSRRDAARGRATVVEVLERAWQRHHPCLQRMGIPVKVNPPLGPNHRFP